MKVPPRSAVVYLATNRLNGKRYVGVTSHTLAKRRNEHASVAKKSISQGAFHRAIRKYGIEVFDFVEIDKHNDLALAKLSEIDWIASIHPEYNSTKGGDGQLGRPVTQRMRDRAKEVHTGNKYRLGKGHSDETKKKLAAAAENNVHLFNLYRHLGPTSMARPVICLDDGKIYPSASAAAREYGSAKSAVIELCLGKNYRQKVNGRRFAYVKKESA